MIKHFKGKLMMMLTLALTLQPITMAESAITFPGHLKLESLEDEQTKEMKNILEEPQGIEEKSVITKEPTVKVEEKVFCFSEKQIKEIDEVIKSCGRGISVFYKDLKSDYSYTYNEDEKYFIASLIKAPYCMYVYKLASEGQCDLNKKYTYLSKHKAEGTGKIKNMKLGTSFTLNELIAYAIQYSDNVAMNIIKENFPVEGYRQYAESLGLKYPENIKNATNGYITALDVGIYINAINDFINNNKYGEELKRLMLATTNPMIVSKYPVIRKYGWAKASFHDMAIIEAPRPYLLCILTNHDGDFNCFKKISTIIEKNSQEGSLE